MYVWYLLEASLRFPTRRLCSRHSRHLLFPALRLVSSCDCSCAHHSPFVSRWMTSSRSGFYSLWGSSSRGCEGEDSQKRKAGNYSFSVNAGRIWAARENAGISTVIHVIHRNSGWNHLRVILPPESCYPQSRMHTDRQSGTLSNIWLIKFTRQGCFALLTRSSDNRFTSFSIRVTCKQYPKLGLQQQKCSSQAHRKQIVHYLKGYINKQIHFGGNFVK